MLTSDLLVTKISGGKIEPAYAHIDHGTLELARSIIKTFQEHVGRSYGEILEALEPMEGSNYRLVRGIAQILERRCVFESGSDIDPLIARRMVFEESRGSSPTKNAGCGFWRRFPGSWLLIPQIWNAPCGLTRMRTSS